MNRNYQIILIALGVQKSDETPIDLCRTEEEFCTLLNPTKTRNKNVLDSVKEE